MINSKKANFIGGNIGATIGCLGWIVICSIAIKSFAFLFLSLVWILIGIFGIIKLYGINPKQKQAISGLNLVWAMVLCFIFANTTYGPISCF